MTTVDERDNQMGRARVKDNPELEAFYEDLAKIDTGALWTVANDIEPWEADPGFGTGALEMG